MRLFFTLESAAFLLASLQVVPDAAGIVKQAGISLELVKSAVNPRQLDSVHR
jgi:hypothetical protein